MSERIKHVFREQYQFSVALPSEEDYAQAVSMLRSGEETKILGCTYAVTAVTLNVLGDTVGKAVATFTVFSDDLEGFKKV